MNRFCKTHRLIKKSDFNHVFNQAKKLVYGNLTLLYRANTLPNSRLGFAISKRYVNRAVLRNKIRRIIKESFRLNKTLPAYDMVILMNQPCDKQKIHDIHQNIEKLWQKLK